MINYNNPYVQKNYTLLIPLVGNFVAWSILKTQTTKLGLTEEKISKADLPNLAERIRKGMMVFISGNGAKQIASKITSII